MPLGNLVPYQRTLRPMLPESFPYHVDTELQKIATMSSDLVRTIVELEARLAALEPPRTE